MLTKLEIIESKYTTFIIFFLSFYSFFGYLLPEFFPYLILASTLVFLFFFYLMKIQTPVSYNKLFPIYLLTAFIISELIMTRFSIYQTSSTKIVFVRSTMLAVGILLIIKSNISKKSLTLIFYFSFIHTFFTIISYLTPSLFAQIVLPFFPSSVRSANLIFLSNKVYAGITDQVGRNAFYISTGIAVTFSDLLLNNFKKKKLKYLILGFFLLSLLLTGKRGPLVSNLISILIVSTVYAKIQGKTISFKIIKISLSITVAIIALISFFPESMITFERFTQNQQGDQTSGRIFLFIYAIDLFLQKPFFGWGAGVFGNIYSRGNHNIFLQLLSEDGLWGFIIFTTFLFVNLYKTYRKLKIFNSKNESLFKIQALLFSFYIQVFFLIYGLTGNPLNDGFILIIYLISVTIPYTIKMGNNNIMSDVNVSK